MLSEATGANSDNSKFAAVCSQYAADDLGLARNKTE